jgi:hypothetical protein
VIPVLVPYTNLRPETRASLADQDVLYLDVSGAEDDYYWALQGFWQRQQGVIVVEHDIVAYPVAIEALRACESDWCGVPYLVGRNFVLDLGLTKFSPAIMAAYPEAVNRMENTHWKTLDGQLLGYLRPLRGGPHWHWPAARHLNDCGDETRVLANCGECGSPLRFENLRAGPNNCLCPRGHYVNYFSKG